MPAPNFCALRGRTFGAILNFMVQYLHLDVSFAALADATRRGVLAQLGNSDASISELAEQFEMTLTGMKKHVRVLEQAGLVVTEKVGRVRTCRLGPRQLAEEAAFLDDYRRLWAARFDQLDTLVQDLKLQEKSNGTRTKK
jgi:DNA-binding transcriptional ArsR family regulator